jgi:hypothetical protein
MLRSLLALTGGLFLLGACNWRVRVEKHGVEDDSSPLIWMLRDASLEEFEAAVREHPAWIEQKSRHLPDNANQTPLAAAAILAQTNHVRLLIRYGADVREAVRWCKRYDFSEGIELIQSVCRESGKQIPASEKAEWERDEFDRHDDG